MSKNNDCLIYVILYSDNCVPFTTNNCTLNASVEYILATKRLDIPFQDWYLVYLAFHHKSDFTFILILFFWQINIFIISGYCHFTFNVCFCKIALIREKNLEAPLEIYVGQPNEQIHNTEGFPVRPQYINFQSFKCFICKFHNI